MTKVEERAVKVLDKLASGDVDIDEVGNLIRDIMHELRKLRKRDNEKRI